MGDVLTIAMEWKLSNTLEPVPSLTIASANSKLDFALKSQNFQRDKRATALAGHRFPARSLCHKVHLIPSKLLTLELARRADSIRCRNWKKQASVRFPNCQ